jgi:hypothetical protein
MGHRDSFSRIEDETQSNLAFTLEGMSRPHMLLTTALLKTLLKWQFLNLHGVYFSSSRACILSLHSVATFFSHCQIRQTSSI